MEMFWGGLAKLAGSLRSLPLLASGPAIAALWLGLKAACRNDRRSGMRCAQSAKSLHT
jgi:hypothetical protein